MKRRVIWLVVSCWMAAALLLASCAPAAVKEEEKKAATPPVKKEEVVAPEKKEEVKAEAEKPQYGGTFTMVRADDVNAGWKFTNDLVSARTYGAWWHMAGTILEGWIEYDPLKGPRGTKQWGYEPVPDPNPLIQQGWLAESWEIDAANETIKMKMREGIYWQDGTKFTAEDVVYTLRLVYGGLHVKSPWPITRPYIRDLKEPAKSIYLDPADPTGRTVVVVSAPGLLGQLWVLVFGYWNLTYPRSLGTRDGFGTWQDVFGTGPYVITDYVAGSSLTFGRAPNYTYRGFDPFHPENRLPYLDRIKWLVIPDLSTRLAALRTGKIDMLNTVDADDAETIWRFNPEIKWRSRPASSSPSLAVRHDVVPFGDVRVRRALMMAINQDELVKDLYGGKATKFKWPTYPGQPMDIYVPLEEMPRDVQELYEYHPDKAKQLLAEAGYPDGFKLSAEVSSTNNNGIDVLTILKEYFAKVKVDVSIDIKEPAVFEARGRTRSYPQGYMTSLSAYVPYNWFHTQPNVLQNYGIVNDPVANKWMEIQSTNYVTNPAEWVRLWPEVTAELQKKAFYIQTPLPDQYNFWQPWVKGYYGENSRVGSPNFTYNDLPVRGIWIDQEMKKTMRR